MTSNQGLALTDPVNARAIAPWRDASFKNLAGTISGGKGTAYPRRNASACRITSLELISPPPTAMRAGSIKIARLAT